MTQRDEYRTQREALHAAAAQPPTGKAAKLEAALSRYLAAALHAVLPRHRRSTRKPPNPPS
jgi:hypothetical protein